MAILYDKVKNKYIELNLFPAENEPEWLTYKLYGGKINAQTKTELFRLDNKYLYFFNSYEKEVEEIIVHLRDIKQILHYRFEPRDDREFLLIADYRDDTVYITLSFATIDSIDKTELQDNTFAMETTELLLEEFLSKLKQEYDSVTV